MKMMGWKKKKHGKYVKLINENLSYYTNTKQNYQKIPKGNKVKLL